MIYLLSAIVSSALVSIFMRMSEKRIRSNMVMFTANYAVCLALSRYYMGNIRLFTTANGIETAIVLGIVSGILYLVNFMLLQKNMRHNGIVLASIFMKLGILVPTLMAIFVFKERPEVTQLIGVVIALAAIILINLEKGGHSSGGKRIWLLILLLTTGFTDSMANIYDKNGSAALKDHYLFYTFLAALLLAFLMVLMKRQRVGFWDVFFGILIGIPNYFASRFLLLSLANVPAVVTYPVYSVGTLVVITVISAILFKERLSSQKKTALVMILVALVLLNM